MGEYREAVSENAGTRSAWLDLSVRIALNGPAGPFDLDVNLAVEKGSFVALVGPSGAGKTTLLRIIAGLARPDAGRVRLGPVLWHDSVARANIPVRRRSIGFVFQDYALFPNMTVRGNVAYAIGGRPSAEELSGLLTFVGLEGLADAYPDRLSGGQKQRLALIRALARRPDILMLDEPLSALDPAMRRQLQDELKRLHRSFGTTTLLVSHDVSEIRRLSDRVVRLEDGRIVFDGDPVHAFDDADMNDRGNGSMNSAGKKTKAVLLHAAGSLRGALSDVAHAFEAETGIPVEGKFGPSGLLKGEIVAGAPWGIFASANMEHPKSLAAAGLGGPEVLFVRNRMCALVRPGLAITPETLLDRMLDAQVKLGTSTPVADPSGDYAWEIFRRADKVRSGNFAALDAKALKLTGGAVQAPPPDGRNPYGALIAEDKADIFLNYRTAARVAVRENPGQQIIELPDALAVGADYGLVTARSASAEAYHFAMFVLSSQGQRILADHGFDVARTS